MLESLGGFLIIAGVLVTIVVCAIMPHINGIPYATNAFVWRDWENATGYTNNGFVFVLGMLNGAFAVGTADIVSHLAEEIPRHVSKIETDPAHQWLTQRQTQRQHPKGDSSPICDRLFHGILLSHRHLLRRF